MEERGKNGEFSVSFVKKNVGTKQGCIQGEGGC